ncbi:hypothetical protein HK096_002773, partial [Nowakowskiella sp. JEL0078]
MIAALIADNGHLLAFICHTSFIGESSNSIAMAILTLLRNQPGRFAEDFVTKLLDYRVD